MAIVILGTYFPMAQVQRVDSAIALIQRRCGSFISMNSRARATASIANYSRLKIRSNNVSTSSERAILAGGCFWGMQSLLRRFPGVISTRVGYSGGDVPNATYRDHEGHAEAIEIIFDPDKLTYRTLLEFFFQIHDPTTLNRQGNDRGTSYRSAIFYTYDEQKRIASDTIADVEASGIWPGKVVSEVAPAGPFWEAEPEHQDYLEHHPDGYTCHFIRPNWRLPHRHAKTGWFPKLKTDSTPNFSECVDPSRQSAIGYNGKRIEAVQAAYCALSQGDIYDAREQIYYADRFLSHAKRGGARNLLSRSRSPECSRCPALARLSVVFSYVPQSDSHAGG